MQITPVSPITVTDEDKLEYMPMPTQMATFDVNSKIYEWDDSIDLSQCKAFLENIYTKLDNYNIDDDNLLFTVTGLNNENIAYLNALLGEGEVSAVIKQQTQIVNIQESIFTGIWRVMIVDNDDNLIKDYIEVGDIPEVLIIINKEKPNSILFDAGLLPDNITNAPAILTELVDKRKAYKMRSDSRNFAEIINLTLLPHTQEDLDCINNVLELGESVILSRGYGNCRITSTGISAIWWVRYFNSTDNEILSTIEVTDIPIVTCAAQEDLVDSAKRLKEFISEL